MVIELRSTAKEFLKYMAYCKDIHEAHRAAAKALGMEYETYIDKFICEVDQLIEE